MNNSRFEIHYLYERQRDRWQLQLQKFTYCNTGSGKQSFTRQGVASDVSHRRQWQAMFHTADSGKQCFTRQVVATWAMFHTAGSSKQCFTPQGVASNVSHGRQWQAMFHTAGSGKQYFTRQAVASNVSHTRQRPFIGVAGGL